MKKLFIALGSLACMGLVAVLLSFSTEARIETHDKGSLNTSSQITTEDSLENMISYQNSLLSIHNKYQNLMNIEVSKGNVNLQAVRALLREAASELQNTPVPASLAASHQEIIAAYLQQEASLKGK